MGVALKFRGYVFGGGPVPGPAWLPFSGRSPGAVLGSPRPRPHPETPSEGTRGKISRGRAGHRGESSVVSRGVTWVPPEARCGSPSEGWSSRDARWRLDVGILVPGCPVGTLCLACTQTPDAWQETSTNHVVCAFRSRRERRCQLGSAGKLLEIQVPRGSPREQGQPCGTESFLCVCGRRCGPSHGPWWVGATPGHAGSQGSGDQLPPVP